MQEKHPALGGLGTEIECKTLRVSPGPGTHSEGVGTGARSEQKCSIPPVAVF